MHKLYQLQYGDKDIYIKDFVVVTNLSFSSNKIFNLTTFNVLKKERKEGRKERKKWKRREVGGEEVEEGEEEGGGGMQFHRDKQP